MTTRLSCRLNRLEAAGGSQRPLPLVIVMPDETDDEAFARWRNEHPGEDLYAAGRVLIIRIVGSAPSDECDRRVTD
jgi:hypothetical protein